MSEQHAIEFVRSSERQRDFDGRWQVWIGSRYFGIVRKSADPIKLHEAWGFESVPFGHYANGQTCDGGHRTRKLAALSLVGRILSTEVSASTGESTTIGAASPHAQGPVASDPATNKREAR